MRIAILIPSYNSAETIAETLDSVQEQLPDGACNIDIYLADDGSKDNTVGIARETWRADIPLQMIARERNLGQWPNKNAALAEISREAEWVLILHSDDTARSDWLSVLLSRMDRCPASVATICSGWQSLSVQHPVNTKKDDAPPKIKHIKGTQEAIRMTLLKGCWWLISGCAIRLSAFQDVGPFDNQFPDAGDYDWLLRCLHKGWDVEFVDKNLVFHRRRQDSVSGAAAIQHLDIRETVQIRSLYAGLLPTTDIIRLYVRPYLWLSRRMVRSVLNRDKLRLLRAWSTLFWVIRQFPAAALYRSLAKSGQTR
jgi:glycosyltransferase involved in cell wall biosynthesis